MRFYIKIVMALLGLAITNQLAAQRLDRQVISNSGEHLESANYKLNFTLGEAVASLEDNGSFMLTQGFQQASLESTSIDIKAQEVKVDYSIYPNPTSSNITLRLESDEQFSLQLKIVNALGQNVLSKYTMQGLQASKTIRVSSLPQGVYYINLLDEKAKLVQNIKFIKN